MHSYKEDENEVTNSSHSAPFFNLSKSCIKKGLTGILLIMVVDGAAVSKYRVLVER